MTQEEQKKKHKLDPDLRKKMREMEDKNRELAPRPVVEDAAPEEMSFDQWWITINKIGKLRPHLKEILEVDFKARGLSKKETKERYDEALKVFGIKL